jgi:hypothetical protein
MRFGFVGRVSMALVGISLAATPSFAQSFERGWVDVNFGVAIAAEDSFRMQGSDIRFGEEATFTIDYNQPRGAAFDFGGGFMITPVFGVGVSFTGTAHEEEADLSARIPHPIFANAHATGTAPTDEKLTRTEGGVNVQAMIVALQSDRLRVRFFGGPTYFRVTQDAVHTINYSQQFAFLTPTNNVTVTSFDGEELEENGWGFHAGGDVSVFFNRIIGVGGFGRFSRANIDLPNTMAISSNDADTVEIKAGGFQVGGGLRLKF